MDIASTSKSYKVFVDAHVHIHDCFNLQNFFDATIDNFLEAYNNSGELGKQPCFVLLLCESTEKNYYQKLCELSNSGQILSSQNGLFWSFKATFENGALQACRSDGQNVFLLAGRQIVTEEKLEVLALLTTALFKENRTLIQTVKDVRDYGGIPVLPWGFGKWLGKRGRILKKFIMENDCLVFLGDNSGRPVFWPRPKLFSVIEAKGSKVLPGSDPLPLPKEIYRVGSFGFTTILRHSSDLVLDLKKCLEGPSSQVSAYGKPEKFMRFFRNQLLLRNQRV